jgi:hypothetical protein
MRIEQYGADLAAWKAWMKGNLQIKQYDEKNSLLKTSKPTQAHISW